MRKFVRKFVNSDYMDPHHSFQPHFSRTHKVLFMGVMCNGLCAEVCAEVLLESAEVCQLFVRKFVRKFVNSDYMDTHHSFPVHHSIVHMIHPHCNSGR